MWYHDHGKWHLILNIKVVVIIIAYSLASQVLLYSCELLNILKLYSSSRPGQYKSVVSKSRLPAIDFTIWTTRNSIFSASFGMALYHVTISCTVRNDTALVTPCHGTVFYRVAVPRHARYCHSKNWCLFM
jgi:hypothetical protein